MRYVASEVSLLQLHLSLLYKSSGMFLENVILRGLYRE